jgi:hypothetical protein
MVNASQKTHFDRRTLFLARLHRDRETEVHTTSSLLSFSPRETQAAVIVALLTSVEHLLSRFTSDQITLHPNKCRAREVPHEVIMDTLHVVSETGTDSTIEKRIELILDLARRLELLDDLLRTARAKRCATDTEVSLADVDQAKLDAMFVL